jgi:hypothetical protein
VHIAFCLAPFAFSFLYGVFALPHNRAPFLGFLASFLLRYVWESSKAHFMTSGKDGVAQNPLRTVVVAFVEP